MRPASASAKREVSSSACERRSNAHTCRPGHALDDLARVEREVARAAVVARASSRSTRLALAGPNLVTKTLSYFAGPGPGRRRSWSPSRPPRRGRRARAARISAASPDAWRRNLPWGRGRPHRIRPRQGHGRRAPAARRLVQARAPRPHDDRRAQRRGQDDAAADAVGRDLDRRRRARARQGHARRAARPAPAARARPHPARLRARGLHASRSSSRPSSRAWSTRWPRATSRR